MTKRYYYEYFGRVLIQAENQQSAENLINEINVNEYIIDEQIYEIDKDYVAIDLGIREKQFGSIYHPLDQADEFERYKKRFYRYNPIFLDFLNWKINKEQLINEIHKADSKVGNDDDCRAYAEISMIDLESKKLKTARLVSVE